MNPTSLRLPDDVILLLNQHGGTEFLVDTILCADRIPDFQQDVLPRIREIATRLEALRPGEVEQQSEVNDLLGLVGRILAWVAERRPPSRSKVVMRSTSFRLSENEILQLRNLGGAGGIANEIRNVGLFRAFGEAHAGSLEKMARRLKKFEASEGAPRGEIVAIVGLVTQIQLRLHPEGLPGGAGSSPAATLPG